MELTSHSQKYVSMYVGAALYIRSHTVEALRMWLDTTYKKVVYSNFQRLAVLTYPFSTAVHSKYVAP